MTSPLLGLYHRLPYPGRTLAASLRGAYLKRWRYGSETKELVAAALERESWTPQQWEKWQESRLTELLERAVERVPYYRYLWAARPASELSSWSNPASWPILAKEALRRHPEEFVADDCRPNRMFQEQTSGTTGMPLRLWWGRNTVRCWYALQEARTLRWNGLSQKEPWAILGGQLIAPAAQQRPPFWVWNAPMRQLYLSSYHLAPAHTASYLEAMQRHGVSHLLGYPSAMHALALAALEQGLDVPELRVAITNAEPLFSHQQDVISEAFRCPVRETYGQAELVAAASECDAGSLHLWPEVGFVEVLDDEGRPVPLGESGRLVCTGLLNTDMPLIRYDTGDRGRLAEEGTTCTCGRRLPILEEIEGRQDDILVTPDGRKIGRLDPVFKADLPVREAQIVQESPVRVLVKVVPTREYTPAHAEEIASRLRDRVGPDMEIEIATVDHIERGPAGKFRAVVSLVEKEIPIGG